MTKTVQIPTQFPIGPHDAILELDALLMPVSGDSKHPNVPAGSLIPPLSVYPDTGLLYRDKRGDRGFRALHPRSVGLEIRLRGRFRRGQVPRTTTTKPDFLSPSRPESPDQASVSLSILSLEMRLPCFARLSFIMPSASGTRSQSKETSFSCGQSG